MELEALIKRCDTLEHDNRLVTLIMASLYHGRGRGDIAQELMDLYHEYRVSLRKAQEMIKCLSNKENAARHAERRADQRGLSPLREREDPPLTRVKDLEPEVEVVEKAELVGPGPNLQKQNVVDCKPYPPPNGQVPRPGSCVWEKY